MLTQMFDTMKEKPREICHFIQRNGASYWLPLAVTQRDWSPARPAYVVFWCWSMLVFPEGRRDVGTSWSDDHKERRQKMLLTGLLTDWLLTSPSRGLDVSITTSPSSPLFPTSSPLPSYHPILWPNSKHLVGWLQPREGCGWGKWKNHNNGIKAVLQICSFWTCMKQRVKDKTDRGDAQKAKRGIKGKEKTESWTLYLTETAIARAAAWLMRRSPFQLLHVSHSSVCRSDQPAFSSCVRTLSLSLVMLLFLFSRHTSVYWFSSGLKEKAQTKLNSHNERRLLHRILRVLSHFSQSAVVSLTQSYRYDYYFLSVLLCVNVSVCECSHF